MKNEALWHIQFYTIVSFERVAVVAVGLPHMPHVVQHVRVAMPIVQPYPAQQLHMWQGLEHEQLLVEQQHEDAQMQVQRQQDEGLQKQAQGQRQQHCLGCNQVQQVLNIQEGLQDEGLVQHDGHLDEAVELVLVV